MRYCFWLFTLLLSLMAFSASAAITCDAADSFEQIAFDNFSSDQGLWRGVDFNRTVSNWPNESIRNTGNGLESLNFVIRRNRLSVQGNDNEFGMVAYNFGALDPAAARQYSITTNIASNVSRGTNTNNDVGIVFGYQDERNYYLARWTKIGRGLRDDTLYPGTYRQLDLVKVADGTATLLDSAPSTGTSAGTNFAMKVVVTSDGTGVCLGNSGGNNMSLVLSSNEVPSLQTTGLYSYDNHNIVRYSNFEVRCDDCARLVANYRMDEQSWNGNTSEVVDQTGNYNATAINGALTSEISPALTGDPGTCRYGSFDGANDYVELPSNFDNLQGSFTITAWINPSNLDSGSRIFIDDENNSDQGYGFSLGDPGNGRLRFYSRGVSPVSVDTASSISPNTWSFVAAVHDSVNKTRQIYINGVAQPVDGSNTISTYTGNWGTASGPATIGGETDRGETANRFTGDIDEVRVYKGALTSAQISNIFTERHPCPTSSLLAHYDFEQNDISSQINDTSGLDNHAFSIGGLLDTDSKFCRGFDSNGDNTDIATGNAFRSSLDLDEDVGVTGTISFWFNSDIDWGAGKERVLFDASCNGNPNCGGQNDKYFVLEIAQNGRLKFSVEDSNDRDFSFQESSASSRTADTWYYVTATWDFPNDRFELYVDGNLRARRVFDTNGQIIELNQIVFGDNASRYARGDTSNFPSTDSSQGRYDEIKIYGKVLTAAEIQADMQVGTDCADNKQVFQIRHDGLGLTCEPEPIQVIACTDGNCRNIDSSVNTDVTLAINGGLTRTISLANGKSPDLNVSGRAEINYNQAGNAELSLTLGGDNGFECGDFGGNTRDCNIAFDTAGFVFNGVKNGTAGLPINNVTIEAKQDNGSGQCQTLFVNQNRTVDLALGYLTPNNQGSNPYTIDGKVIPDISSGNYQDVNLRFDATGKATLPNNIHNDAGQVQLIARYIQPANLPTQPGFTLMGNSGAFWVKPHYINILVEKNDGSALDGTTADSLITHTASAPFKVTFEAVNYGGSTTSNYQPSNLQINLQRTGPTDDVAVEGKLSLPGLTLQGSTLQGAILPVAEIISGTPGNIDPPSFSAGKYETSSAKYSEVGLVTLDVSDTNFGDQTPKFVVDGGLWNANNRSETTEIGIGRFIPAYFIQTVKVDNHGSLSGDEVNWVYSGQEDASGKGSIRYQQPPTITITAYNNDNQVTQNYIGDFRRLLPTGIKITAQAEDSKVGKLNSKLAISKAEIIINNTLFARTEKGEVDYRLSTMDNFAYAHEENAEIPPFEPDFTLVVNSIEDKDGVKVDTNTPSHTEDIRPKPHVNSSNESFKVRFGRLAIDNSFGPETSDLQQKLYVEYLNDSNVYQLNTDDNLTTLELAKLTLSNINLPSLPSPATGVKSLSTLMLSGGEFTDFSLLAPGANNLGQTNVFYESPTWLKYDWDDTLNHDNNASAVATFGRYRGNDRIIYWREVN
ncbi:LamG domain-containing protein [Thalassotalea euphylliae]|uniref:LamG domain-containing protein n=1 Tax=Thalassotalea euphylliae TaxID=1655234 RepID=A0A3E0TUL0_9GAMM|nr:LamG domain-containing protein [Thalassotalea euphylliae]REL28159.1 LamG domain-containing protein [Thalassotalea euphylliae]